MSHARRGTELAAWSKGKGGREGEQGAEVEWGKWGPERGETEAGGGREERRVNRGGKRCPVLWKGPVTSQMW